MDRTQVVEQRRHHRGLVFLRLLLFPPFALRRVEVLPTLLFPILSVSTACIGFRFGSAASFHFPDNVGLGFRTSDWQKQQDRPLPGLLMKQNLFIRIGYNSGEKRSYLQPVVELRKVVHARSRVPRSAVVSLRVGSSNLLVF